MYTFDVSEEAATATYHEVCAAYERIFKILTFPVRKGAAVYSGTSDMLGRAFSPLFRGCPFIGGRNVWTGGEQYVHCREVVHSQSVHYFMFHCINDANSVVQ